MRTISFCRMGGLAMLLLSSSLTYAVHVDTLKNAIDTQTKTELSAQKSQQKIDGLSEQTDQMLAEYRSILRQTDSLQIYNEQLEKLVGSQQDEMASIESQLVNIETTQREIVPLMLKMIDVMVEFVDLDVPFLPDERATRIIALQSLMERADVSLAEKYRRILEAYQVETEYGRTIEAYQGDLTLNGKERTVDFLRIGRVSLYFLSLDGQQAGVWNDGWQDLDDSYRQAIEKGLKVAKKQLPPDLLILPVKTGGQAQ